MSEKVDYNAIFAMQSIERTAKNIGIFTENDPEYLKKIELYLVNYFQPNYEGQVKEENILTSGENTYVPLPSDEALWAENKIQEAISQGQEPAITTARTSKHIIRTAEGDKEVSYVDPQENNLRGNICLTYYQPFAQSFVNETSHSTKDGDGVNKHFYSHCKSAIYGDNNPVSTMKVNGTLLASNPELDFNSEGSKESDPTHYVPIDSVSYIINIDKLGLKKEDVELGYYCQSYGYNIMDPEVQKVIYDALHNKQDNIDDKTAALDALNKNRAEEYNRIDKQNTEKKHFEDMNYNLQDYSCAIRPTAPLIFASEMKIMRENMNETDALQQRRNLGIPNIHDDRYEKNCIDKNGKKVSINDEIREGFDRQVKKGISLMSKKEIDASKKRIFSSVKKLVTDSSKNEYNDVKQSIKKDCEKFKKVKNEVISKAEKYSKHAKTYVNITKNKVKKESEEFINNPLDYVNSKATIFKNRFSNRGHTH